LFLVTYKFEQKNHGAPTDEERHVGDLGNVVTDAKGVAKVQIEDKLISLAPGVTSIVGRGLVVHAGADDEGRGGTPESLTNGNSGTANMDMDQIDIELTQKFFWSKGKKYGCGVIGIAA